jgi:hypothetical protein
MLALAALAGVAAAALFVARSRDTSSPGLRERWDGEAPQAIDDDAVVPS